MIYDGEQYYTQKPKQVDAVDTLGAGDSFATAFLLAMLEKKDIHAAMEAGAEFAAKTCLVNGASRLRHRLPGRITEKISYMLNPRQAGTPAFLLFAAGILFYLTCHFDCFILE